MWFWEKDPFETKARWRFPGVRVNATLKTRNRLKAQRNTLLIVVPIAVLVGLLAAWVGIHYVGRAIFSTNPRFTIRQLEIKAGENVNDDLIREYTGINVGTNLFAVDIERVRAEILKKQPNMKSMDITRVLPDTVKIVAVERTPRARIGWGGNLLVDSDGCVFWQRNAVRSLPAVISTSDEIARPGSRLSGMAMAAIEAVESFGDPRFGLELQSVSVDANDCLVVNLLAAGIPWEGRLSWKGMGRHTLDSHRRLVERLTLASRALQQADRTRRYTKFDATYDDGNIHLQ